MIQVTTSEIKQVQLSDDEGTFATLTYDPKLTEPLYCQECYEDMAKDVLDVLDGLDIRDAITALKLAIGMVEDAGNIVAATTHPETQEGKQELSEPEKATETGTIDSIIDQLAADMGLDRSRFRTIRLDNLEDIEKLFNHTA